MDDLILEQGPSLCLFRREGGHIPQKATKNGRDTEAGALGCMRDFTDGSLKASRLPRLPRPHGLAVLPGSRWQSGTLPPGLPPPFFASTLDSCTHCRLSASGHPQLPCDYLFVLMSLELASQKTKHEVDQVSRSSFSP